MTDRASNALSLLEQARLELIAAGHDELAARVEVVYAEVASEIDMMHGFVMQVAGRLAAASEVLSNLAERKRHGA